jgi:hypothetical protein
MRLTCNEMMTLLACYRGTFAHEFAIGTRWQDTYNLRQLGLLDTELHVTAVGQMWVEKALHGGKMHPSDGSNMERLEKLARTDPIVNKCLMLYQIGDRSLEDALVDMVGVLSHNNAVLTKRLVDAEARRHPISKVVCNKCDVRTKQRVPCEEGENCMAYIIPVEAAR